MTVRDNTNKSSRDASLLSLTKANRCEDRSEIDSQAHNYYQRTAVQSNASEYRSSQVCHRLKKLDDALKMANCDTISNSQDNISDLGKLSSSQDSIKKDAAILGSRVSRDREEFESINHS